MKFKNLLTLLVLFSYFHLYSQGNCLNFDGTSDYVQINSPLSGDADFTVEAWFIDERTGNSSAYNRIIGWNSFSFEIGAPNGILRYYDGSSWKDTGVNIRDNSWHHVAVTREGDFWKCYLDGSLILDLNQSKTMNFSSYFVIGMAYWGSEFWQGNIDEVRIWDTALTAAQLDNVRDCELSGNEPCLVGYWSFNQGIDSGDNSAITSLNDSHSNGNNGVLNSFSLNGATSNWIASGAGVSGNCTGVTCGSVCLSDNTFTGNDDNNWDNPLNWTEGCVPTSPYEGNIIIEADCEISGEVDFVLLTASTFTINSGVTLVDNGTGDWSFAGTLTNNGTLEKPSITNTGTYKGNGRLIGSLTNDGNIVIGSD